MSGSKFLLIVLPHHSPRQKCEQRPHFMHEFCHTMGVGQHPNWGKLMVDHLWQGKHANQLLQQLTRDPKAQLHGDRMHFWPYGLNYDPEVKSDEDLIRHAMIVEAIAKDLDEAQR